MEASTRFLNLSSRHLLYRHHSLRNPNFLHYSKLPNCPCHGRVRASSHFLSPRNPNQPKPFLSLSISSPAQSFHSTPKNENLDQINGSDLSNRGENITNVKNLGFLGGKGGNLTVVLLGWLGAEERHLKKYAEMYDAKGFRSVRFVVPLKETVKLDFCKSVEEKIERLGNELVDWCLEEDGKERCLIFHTFSNTGWLIYGVLLQNFQSRNGIIEKIKGCVVDSAPSAEIDPRVWAAGYCAAILKKRSSSLAEPINGSKVNGKDNNTQDIIPALIEVVVLKVLEIFFSLVLSLPYANKRLSNIISTLKEQPPCPQLYLYSSADKVIPASVVESFIKEQKALGRIVFAYNFGSSPHVDHFRNFPHLYSEKVNEFLEYCCSTAVSNT